MGGKVEVRGLEKVIQNMKDFTEKQKAHLDRSAALAANVLYEDVMAKVETVDEHDLNVLSHWFQYAGKDNEIKYIGAYSTKVGTDSGPHPDEFVHEQSGLLAQSVEQISERQGDKYIIAVGVRESKVPYIKYLIDGTTKMRSRDFLGHSWIEKQQVVLDIIKNGLTLDSARGGIVK